MKPETKYKGSIKLSAIGDALGWVTEFEKSPSSVITKYQVERIERFYDWKKTVGGRFYGYIDNIKAGSYSDDTQLMLSVARSVEKGGNVNQEYFSKIELINWLDYARGGGRTVKTAADKIARKSVKWYNNFYSFKINGEKIDYRQSGANGAAMRVLPIALANLGNIEKIKKEIFCNSIITHGHPRAIIGAILYGCAVNQIILYRPDDFNWEQYITLIGSDLPSKLALSSVLRQELSQWVIEWDKGSTKRFEDIYQETIVETQNQLRTIYQSLKRDTPTLETLQKIGCFDPSTKGSGIATVVAGIYLAAKFNDRPIDAITEAVNSLGADTDSIASFVGGLVGALHGHGIIPEKWKRVQDAEYLDSVAERLLAISEDRFEEEVAKPVSDYKSLNGIEIDNFSKDELVNFAPLGIGRIKEVNRQPTLTKGKYNLLLEVNFEIGQSIVLSKLFDKSDANQEPGGKKTLGKDVLLELAEKLNPETKQTLIEYIRQHKNIPQSTIQLLIKVIENKT